MKIGQISLSLAQSYYPQCMFSITLQSLSSGKHQKNKIITNVIIQRPRPVYPSGSKVGLPSTVFFFFALSFLNYFEINPFSFCKLQLISICSFICFPGLWCADVFPSRLDSFLFRFVCINLALSTVQFEILILLTYCCQPEVFPFYRILKHFFF